MNFAQTWPGSAASRRSHTRANRKLESISTLATLAFVALFATFVAATGAFGVYAQQHDGKVYEGVTVAGVDLGGMTRDDVRAALQERFKAFADSEITFTAGRNTFPVNVSTLGITLNEEETIDQVMNFGRDGSLWSRSLTWSTSLLDGAQVEPVLDVDEATFRSALSEFAPELLYAPQDARIDMSTLGEAQLVADEPGVVLDVGATRARTVARLADLQPIDVPVSLIQVPAMVQTADIEAGLPTAQRAVASAVMLKSDIGTWGITQSLLNSLVSVDGQGQLQVDDDGVRSFVENMATQIDRPAADAQIDVDENGKFVIVPQVDSAKVDVGKTTSAVVDAIASGSTDVQISVSSLKPEISTESAQEWADKAESMIGKGLELKWHGGTSQLGRADLLAALVIEPQPGKEEPFALSFDPDVITERLAPLGTDLNVDVQEAQFRLVDGEIRFQKEAKQGRQLNVDKSVSSIVAALNGGDASAGIVVDTIEPKYSSKSRPSISLPDVLGQSRTYYGNSSDPRRHNVERAVELEDGWLIAPDEEFSYAGLMGLVDEANGYVTGFGIVADPSGGVTTAPVIGGGICQVSTTIFQAAFWSGVTITERWAHPYWLQSYGQAPYGMQGLDAMVNIEPGWALDLKFKNTTGNWIAVVMTADGENVYAEIRGTDPKWSIDVADPQISDVISPEDTMRYTDSPELPKGQELQVEHARDGFTADITRVVRDDSGHIIDSYEYQSTYAASRNLTLRGTGSDGDQN